MNKNFKPFVIRCSLCCLQRSGKRRVAQRNQTVYVRVLLILCACVLIELRLLGSCRNWPTIPQLFVEGEFIGGTDVTTEMHQKGELAPLLQKAGAIKKRD